MKINNSIDLEVPPDDTVIWRYVDFPKFASFLYNKSLWFTRLDYLTDMYEGELPHENMDEMMAKLYETDPHMPHKEQIRRVLKEAENIRRFKKTIYINSWSMSNIESYALWKIYLNHSNHGVAIKTTVGKVKECFLPSNFRGVIGKVNYLNKVSEVTQDLISGTKKPWYEYEKEFRIIIKDHFNIGKDENNKEVLQPYDIKGLDLKVDLGILVDRIVVSPFCEDWFFEVVKKIVKERPEGLILQKSKVMDR